jgi:DNA-binding NarL/FixJ family response regulator
MGIVVLNTNPVIRVAADQMLERARRHDPRLGQGGVDIAIVAAIGQAGPLLSRPVGAALVVVTDRPALPQAGAALLLGASAYLPIDQPPARTARALRRVAQGRLHLEPETAAILRALAGLGAGIRPHPRVGDIVTALTLHSRGWTWPDASQAADIDPTGAPRWLIELLAHGATGRRI